MSTGYVIRARRERFAWVPAILFNEAQVTKGFVMNNGLFSRDGLLAKSSRFVLVVERMPENKELARAWYGYIVAVGVGLNYAKSEIHIFTCWV